MKKYWFSWILYLLSLLTYCLLQVAPHYPIFIETYFSKGINHWMTLHLSHLTGLIPFSLAEFGLYALILYFLIHTLYRFFACCKHFTQAGHHLKKWFFQTLNVLCILWLIFAWSWDFNYYRIPLETSLNLNVAPKTTAELAALYQSLISDLNTIRPQVQEDANGYMVMNGDFNSTTQRAAAIYDDFSKDYPLFKGHYGKPKSIVASPLMNYTGITGIYAPFTREANLNTAVLPQTLPVTMLHEMAHQRGFAQEDYCNFIAYLASTYSTDPDFRYSGDLLALAHTSQALAKADYQTLLALNQTIDPAVMRDIKQNNAFWKSYEGSIEKASTSLNNHYLKANGVTDGVQSYGRMVDLLLAYYEKTTPLSSNQQNAH